MRLVSCLLIIVIVFCGCGKSFSNEAINITDDNHWKSETAKRLFVEFKEFYNNMGNDDFICLEDKDNRLIYNQQYNKTSYSRLMAVDRAIALLGVYKKYLSNEELLFVENKKDEINKGLFADSHIYFGYTVSGLHVIAVCKGVTNNNLMYQVTCNKIRDLKDESDFFNELAIQKYYACDLYIEDLSGARQTINGLTLSLYSDLGDENLVERDCVFNTSDAVKNILNEYNRTIVEKNGVYKNKSWNLFACSKPFDIVKVNVYGEQVELKDNIR